ncbi:MAG: transposase, partial [Actinomycetota bacterium]|nr:transposase [Actinomycetota bacterium]
MVADQDGLTSRAGTALLAGVADRVGLTGALGVAMGGVRQRASRHCPGRALRDVAVMLADGGDALCDVRALRDEPSLFGPVASDATAWRAIAAVDGERLDEVRRARAVAREQVWAQAGAPRRVILDIDATLITAHSDKQGAAGTFKGGYGFNPLVCFEAETREAM